MEEYGSIHVYSSGWRSKVLYMYIPVGGGVRFYTVNMYIIVDGEVRFYITGRKNLIH